MARKRKNLKALEYKSQEYWNRLLAEEGLSLDSGRNPKLLYIGGSTEIDKMEQHLAVKEEGRTIPPKMDFE